MCWWAAQDEQVGQGRQNILVPELACNDERQAFPAGLIDDGQDPELAALMRAPFDKVIGPDMPRIFGPQADARSVVKP